MGDARAAATEEEDDAVEELSKTLTTWQIEINTVGPDDGCELEEQQSASDYLQSFLCQEYNDGPPPPGNGDVPWSQILQLQFDLGAVQRPPTADLDTSRRQVRLSPSTSQQKSHNPPVLKRISIF